MRLIDADKLRLSYWVSPTSTVSTAGQYYFYSQAEIDNAPTIDAEPVRHGKWIKENIVLTSLPPKRRWHCSECGSIRDGYDETVLTPYCPHCGAKMDGEDNEENKTYYEDNMA